LLALGQVAEVVQPLQLSLWRGCEVLAEPELSLAIRIRTHSKFLQSGLVVAVDYVGCNKVGSELVAGLIH